MEDYGDFQDIDLTEFEDDYNVWETEQVYRDREWEFDVLPEAELKWEFDLVIQAPGDTPEEAHRIVREALERAGIHITEDANVEG